MFNKNENKKTIQVSEEDIKILEKALDCQSNSNMQLDREVLQEAIEDGDWRLATSLIYKFEITDRAFELVKTLRNTGASNVL